MSTLIQEKCEACRKGAPTVTESEIAELKPQIPEWELLVRDDIPRLETGISFR